MKGENSEAPLRVNELGWMKDDASPFWRMNVISVNQIDILEKKTSTINYKIWKISAKS